MPMGIAAPRLTTATGKKRLPKKLRPKNLPRLLVKAATAPARVVLRHLQLLPLHNYKKTRNYRAGWGAIYRYG